jgi:hypothetical protein
MTTKTFTLGQRVSATRIYHRDFASTAVLNGVIVAGLNRYSGYLINFGAGFDGHSGNDGISRGLQPTCWWVQPEHITAIVDAPVIAPVSVPQGKQQSDRILAHLLAGKSITQLEAFGVYRIFRLAARIHELKSKGHKIVTTMRIDETGKQYAEYRLATARRA